MADLSRDAGAHFLLAGISDHPGTGALLGELHQEDVDTSDWSIDLRDDHLRILRDDGHPNQDAHQEMAFKAMDKLTTILEDKR
jgi:lysophospholipase L1-like esterase